jgi:hypothetical protein
MQRSRQFRAKVIKIKNYDGTLHSVSLAHKMEKRQTAGKGSWRKDRAVGV